MTDINIGAITESLNNKSDRDLRNTDTSSGGDAVIEYQIPNADNNYTWYRKYASGWVEQGGYIASSAGSSSTIVSVILPIEMADVNYQVQKTTHGGAVGNHGLGWDWISDFPSSELSNKTTTKINVGLPSNSYVLGIYWEVKGMAAM